MATDYDTWVFRTAEGDYFDDTLLERASEAYDDLDIEAEQKAEWLEENPDKTEAQWEITEGFKPAWSSRYWQNPNGSWNYHEFEAHWLPSPKERLRAEWEEAYIESRG
jgi:hypothetical protein